MRTDLARITLALWLAPAIGACTSSGEPPAAADAGAGPGPDAGVIDAEVGPVSCATRGGACSKQDGLIANWSLDEFSDGTAPVQRDDATPCGHHLSDPYSIRSTPLAQHGSAAMFEWSVEDPLGRLTVDDSPSLSVFHAGSFTIAVWFELLGTDPGAGGKLLVKGYPESQGAHEIGFEHQVGGSCDGGPLPHLHVGVYGDSGGTASCVPRTHFDPDAHVGEWHFMLMSHDFSTKTLSVQIDDGTVFAKSTAGIEIADTTAALNLGGFSRSTLAALDDVMIWNRLLTAEERTSVFTRALTCP